MRKSFCALLLLLLPLCVQAVIPEMKFRRLDTQNGLSNSQVLCSFRDSKGFMWFGTAYGVNRYDGYRFKTFYSNRRDTTSMRDNYTEQVMEAYDGKLWMRQGMSYSVYDPATESFERNASKVLAAYGIKGVLENVYIDSQKRLWAKVNETGVYCYNPKAKKLTHFPAGYGKGQLNPTYGICSMADYGKNGIVMATYQGELVCLDADKGVVVRESHWIRDNGGQRNQEYRVYADSQRNLWVTSTGNTFVYIEHEKRWYASILDLMRAKQIPNVPSQLHTWDVKTDRRGWVWVATDHDGVLVVDFKNHAMRQFLNSRFDTSTLSDNTARNIYVDSRGSVWIGTYKNGVNQYLEGIASLKSLDLGDVNTVCEDRYGYYWIGTNDRGIIVYNPKTNEQVRQYTTQNSNLSSNIMVGSCYASDGTIWFGSYNGGLVHCVPSKEQPYDANVINYRSNGTTDGLAANSIWSITEDRWHRIWLATLGGGVQMLDLKNNKFHTWNSDKNGLPSNYMTSVWWNKKGWLMVGSTWYYSLINPVTGQLLNRVIPDDPSVTASTESSVCVMEDSRGLIWQGSTSGVLVHDPHTRRVKSLDMTDGLLGSSVCSILEDKNHAMWVVTDHGVSKLIPERQEDGTWQFIVRSYSSSDGLQKGTYTQRSAYLTRDGLILVGGQGGLDVINPKGLSNVRSKERPIFSGLQLFDEDVLVGKKVNGRVILRKSLDICREITLRYNDQFTIQLGSDAGNVDNHKRFVYRLEGFNENWVKTSELNPNITYNSLRAGSYTLYVRMLNDDGTIGDEEVEMDITITPPLWRTRWAILLYMIFIACVALVWRSRFIKRQNRRMDTESMRRELEKKQWMNQMRMQLKKEHATVAPQPEKKEPSGVMNVNRHYCDLVSYLRQFAENFVSPDASKAVKINFVSPEKELEAEVDQPLLTEAMQILCNNSVNFAHDDSLISIGLVRQQDGRIQIQVADNGIGIKDEFKEHAFDPMVNSDGIKLDRVKEIVDAHEGTIRIEDNPGGGTIIFITLPPAEEIEEAVLLDDEL